MSDVPSGGYGWSPELQRKFVALAFRTDAYSELGPRVFDAKLIGHTPLRPTAEAVFAACAEQGGRPPSPEMAEQLALERIARLKPAMATVARQELQLVLTADLSDAPLLRAKAAEEARCAAAEQAALKMAALIERGAVRDGGGREILKLMEDALAVGRGSEACLSIIHDEKALGTLLEQYLPRTPTGIAAVDRAMEGGAEPGLHVVGGDAKLGKTSFLVQVAVGALTRKRTVWWVSGEVGLAAMARRCVSSLTGLTKAEIRGNVAGAVRKVRTWRQMGTGEFLVEYAPRFTVSWMASRLRQLEAGGWRVGVVIADFLDIMGTDRRFDGEGARRFELAEIAQGLRDLGAEVGIPVWSGKAMNRRAVNKPVPTEADMGECYQIAFVLDSLWVLCATEKERCQAEPVVRLFHALGREEADKRVVAAYARNNDRQQWTELRGYLEKQAEAAKEGGGG